jgi:SnoaL-like protein
MRRGWIPAAVAVAAVAIAVVGYRVLFPSDEQLIRQRLDSLAATLNHPAAEGLDAMTRAAQVGRAFTDDIEVQTREGMTIRGKETLMAMVARLQPRAEGLNLQIRDVVVTLDDPRHAHVELTATYVDPAGDGRAIDAAEFTLRMVKPVRDWLIARVAPVQVLQR